MSSGEPTPPRGLRPSTRRWWRGVVAGFAFETHHLQLLEQACRALERAEEARELLDGEGLVVRDRWGQPKPHPAAAIERDQRALFARLLAQLGLDAEIPGPPGRPGRRT